MSWDLDELPGPAPTGRHRPPRPEVWLRDASEFYPELRAAGVIPFDVGRTGAWGRGVVVESAGLEAEVRDLQARVKALEQLLVARELGIVAPTARQIKLVHASRNTPEDEDLAIPGIARFHAPPPVQDPWRLWERISLVADADVPADEVQFHTKAYVRGPTFVRIVNLRLPGEP